MRTCPNCQGTYPDEMDFCPRDATPLPAVRGSTQFNLNVGLSQRYRIVRQLGEGGMGSVFLAEQISLGNRPVALKVLRRRLLDDPEFLRRFQDEAFSTGRIHHQNVVTVYECGQTDDGSPYIAMEYLEGETLGDAIQRRGALPLPEAADILHQAARGLNAAHTLGIVHRDLKPDNIFLTWDEDARLLVKIVDFGIAKMRESGTHTVTGLAVGTPAYMSFEQASGMRSEQIDKRSDVYSLGVVAYEMVTGRLPFRADTPMAFLKCHLLEHPYPMESLPPQLEHVVMKALCKERNQRFATAPDFARAFAAAMVPPPDPVVAHVPETPRFETGTRRQTFVEAPAPGTPRPYSAASAGVATPPARSGYVPPNAKTNAGKLIAGTVVAVVALIAAGLAWHALSGGTQAASPPAAAAKADQTQPDPPAAQPRTPPPEQPASTDSDVRSSISAFIDEMLAASEAPPEQDMHRFYSEIVSPYYSLPSASWTSIQEDKASYFQRFPTRHYALVGGLEIKKLSDNEESAGFAMRYSYIRFDGKAVEGISHETWKLTLIDQQWKISGISEELLK